MAQKLSSTGFRLKMSRVCSGKVDCQISTASSFQASGSRGFEGKIAAARFARENNIPCLGLCLGLHARRLNSLEMLPGSMKPTRLNLRHRAAAVIDLMHDQREVTDLGGTMRLGAYYAVLTPGSKVHESYGEPVVSERHRHRYEFNPAYRSRLEEAGLVCSGCLPIVASSSSSSCLTIRSGWQLRPTLNSRVALIALIRYSAIWLVLRWSVPTAMKRAARE